MNTQDWFTSFKIDKLPDRFRNWRKTPNGYYVSILLSLSIIVVIIDIIFGYCSTDDLKNIWLNIHASIVEVFLLGLFITRFNDLQKIRGWKEEIDDYRDWKEPEAAYRLRGLIKRLNTAKKYDLNLRGCYLKAIDLSFTNLAKAHMENTNLEGTTLQGANLQGTHLIIANLKDADLVQAKLQGAFLNGANLEKAFLENAHFEKADLSNSLLLTTSLFGAHFEETLLEGAYVISNNWIDQLEKWHCFGVEEIKAKYTVKSKIDDNKMVYIIHKLSKEL